MNRRYSCAGILGAIPPCHYSLRILVLFALVLWATLHSLTRKTPELNRIRYTPYLLSIWFPAGSKSLIRSAGQMVLQALLPDSLLMEDMLLPDLHIQKSSGLRI